MATITELREQRGMVQILSGSETLARVPRAHFDRCPVAVGDDVDVEALFERLAAVQFADAYEAALCALDRCARSSRQLSDVLRRKGFVPPAIEAVLQRLGENGLIDDARFALRLAELQSDKPTGVYAFRQKLRAKGVSDDDAEEALALFDEDQQRRAALQAARKLYRKYEGLPKREARGKLSQALARRGFGWDAIESAVEALLE